MPTIAKPPSGWWQVQVRRKGRQVSETILRRDEARPRSRVADRAVDRNVNPRQHADRAFDPICRMVDLHSDDMAAVGIPPQRSKAATLAMLCAELDGCKVDVLDRERLIRFGRAKFDAFPVLQRVAGLRRMRAMTWAKSMPKWRPMRLIRSFRTGPSPGDGAAVAIRWTGSNRTRWASSFDARPVKSLSPRSETPTPKRLL